MEPGCRDARADKADDGHAVRGEAETSQTSAMGLAITRILSRDSFETND